MSFVTSSNDLRRGYWVYLLATYVDIMGLCVSGPIMPFIGAELGVSPRDMGMVFSAFIAGFMICSLYTGILVDRLGCKIVCQIMTGGSVAGFLIAGMAPTLPVFIVGRVIGGLFCGSPTVAQTYASRFPDEKLKIDAYLKYGQTIMIALLSSNFPAMLAQLHLRSPFFILAVLSLVAFVTCSIYGTHKSTKPHSNIPGGNALSKENTDNHQDLPHRHCSPCHVLALFTVLALAEASHATAFDFITPIIFVTMYKMEPYQMSIWGVCTAVCALFIMLVILKRLNAKYGLRRVVHLANILGLTSSALLCLLQKQIWQSLPLLIFSQVLLLFYRPVTDSLVQVELSSAVPANRQGLAMGMREVVLNLSRLCMLPLASRLISPSFISAPFLLHAGLRLAAVLSLILLLIVFAAPSAR